VPCHRWNLNLYDFFPIGHSRSLPDYRLNITELISFKMLLSHEKSTFNEERLHLNDRTLCTRGDEERLANCWWRNVSRQNYNILSKNYAFHTRSGGNIAIMIEMSY